ncbi:MAG: chalcone isomerase family protein [Alphaproteobacteria bacterium]|nr:chalcone isomerase family protein [Alphaproteobacteria bacterium]
MRLLLMLALAVSPALAGKLAGVTLPDTVEVGGQKLVLNGMGLREKYFIDIYVGALYLPAKTTDASEAISSDVPKQITMHMTYDLSKDKLAETMRESMNNAGEPEAKKHAETLAGWMEDVVEGDQIILRYEPGTGTSVIVKGNPKGTIEGTPFMRAVWGIYLGPNPPTSALKKGLLGL